jgi:ribosome biogenesis protein NSA1
LSICRKLFAASADGKIHNLSDPEAIIEAGDNISQMRQCSSNSNIVAVGGKERKNNLKIYNLETQKQIFTSKNVPHDSLQLEVPVWDSDMSFVNDTENSIATCSRYGYIRLYDTRQQRRPVKIYTDKRDQAFNTMTERNGLIYVGTTMGSLYAFDLKSMKVPLHTYKGAVGSITSIQLDDTGKFLFTSSLDRFVRVHNAETTHQLYQCYLKIKPTQMVMKSADNILLNEYKIKKQASADVAVDSDQEYDELFKGMQKATDGNDDENVPGPSKKLKMKRHSGMIVGTKNKKAKV